MKISLANSAYEDLADIQAYYEEEGAPQVGKKFIAAIIDHVQGLLDNPEIGRAVPEFGDEKIRELIHPPFRIVYMREQDRIYVIRVWRSERLLKLPGSEA